MSTSADPPDPEHNEAATKLMEILDDIADDAYESAWKANMLQLLTDWKAIMRGDASQLSERDREFFASWIHDECVRVHALITEMKGMTDSDG
jgi:hypothetical protein